MKFNKDFFKNPISWVGTTYFAEGFPYTIIRIISPVFFRDKNVSLENIGLTSLYGLPWTLKFLWAPLVDKYSTKRSWLLSSELLFSIILLITCILSPISSLLTIIGILLFIAALISATHDIAIDGLYMEILEEKEQEKFIGYRILAYRVSIIVGQGIIISIGTIYNWFLAFLTTFIIMLFLLIYHFLFLPKKEKCKNSAKKLLPYILDLLIIPIFFKKLKKKRKKELITILSIYLLSAFIIALKYLLKSSIYVNLKQNYTFLKHFSYARWIGVLIILSLIILVLLKNRIKSKLLKNQDSFYVQSFLSFIDRKKISYAIAFIILIRTGEFMLHAMTGTFFVDLGIKIHIGWITSGIGIPASIFGALLGGWLISKYGFNKLAFILLFIQNITNLMYMFLAWYLKDYILLNTGIENPISIGTINLTALSLTNGFEQFSAGLGTAVLTSYLLKSCINEYKTSHFALGTALMSVSGIIAGILGGIITSEFGYEVLFLTSFIASLPGMFLVFFVPKFD